MPIERRDRRSRFVAVERPRFLRAAVADLILIGGWDPEHRRLDRRGPAEIEQRAQQLRGYQYALIADVIE